MQANNPELLYPINRATFDVLRRNKSEEPPGAERTGFTWSTPPSQGRKTVFLFIIFIARSSFLNYPHSATLPPLASKSPGTYTSELTDPTPGKTLVRQH